MLIGAAYASQPEFTASILGLRPNGSNGIAEVQSFYGGSQIGIGLFLLLAKSQDAMRLLLYSNALMATGRCLCSLIFALRFWKVTFEQPFDRFTHVAVAFLIEYPVAFAAGAAMEIWKDEFARESAVRKNILNKALKTSPSTILLTRFARFVGTLHLILEALAFIGAPRVAGEFYGLEAGHALGIIELQSMFGAFRLGLGMFAAVCDNTTLRLFLSTYYGSSLLLGGLSLLNIISPKRG